MIFMPRQSKIGKGEGIEFGTTQMEFAVPQKTKSKTLLSRKEERELVKKKAAEGKREYGLEAYGVEKERHSSLRKFFVNPVLLLNPRGVIGDPPNPIMRIQLLNLWKQAVGAEDLGDFTTFMKEVSDLTYHEARDKLVRAYGMPGGRESEKIAGAEARLHAGMCDSAAEECEKGDLEACSIACEECGITEACLPQPQEPVQKPCKASITKPIEEIHRYLEERGIKPGKSVKAKVRAKKAIYVVPESGIVKIRAKDVGKAIILRW